MSRARWKFLFFSKEVYKGVFLKKYTRKLPTTFRKITNKASRIPLTYLYLKTRLHKGNVTLNKIINKWMLGHRFGEFTFSRKPFFFPQKKKSKKSTRR